MSTSPQKDPHLVTIHNVRLSYPNLFRPKQGTDNVTKQPTGKPTYGASFLLDKKVNADDIRRLTAAAVFTKQEKWQGKPVNLTGKSIRDGIEKEATEGYGPGVVFISARNDKFNPAKNIVDQNLQPIAEDAGIPYAGCYVDATVRCWAQDNPNGKRLNWSLVNVQYRRKGEPFGERPIAVEETLSKIENEDDTQVDSSINDQI